MIKTSIFSPLRRQCSIIILWFLLLALLGGTYVWSSDVGLDSEDSTFIPRQSMVLASSKTESATQASQTTSQDLSQRTVTQEESLNQPLLGSSDSTNEMTSDSLALHEHSDQHAQTWVADRQPRSMRFWLDEAQRSAIALLTFSGRHFLRDKHQMSQLFTVDAWTAYDKQCFAEKTGLLWESVVQHQHDTQALLMDVPTWSEVQPGVMAYQAKVMVIDYAPKIRKRLVTVKLTLSTHASTSSQLILGVDITPTSDWGD